MKIENRFIEEFNQEITFYIGQKQSENFDVIDKGNANDLWFHASQTSSCHVVAILPEDIERKKLKYIIKVGALLCKNNTNKLKILKNVEITYTQIKNIEKTNVEGCVEIKNSKSIIV